MRYVRVVPLLLAAVTFACTEEPVPSVTAPPELRLAKPVPPGTACNGTLEREIAAEIADLFERPVITNARAYWDVVTDNCLTDLTASREAMLAYVQFTIDRVKANEVVAPDTGTVEGAVLRHWNKTFTYVGYAAPGLPEAVFGSEGAIGVITQTTV